MTLPNLPVSDNYVQFSVTTNEYAEALNAMSRAGWVYEERITTIAPWRQPHNHGSYTDHPEMHMLLFRRRIMVSDATA